MGVKTPPKFSDKQLAQMASDNKDAMAALQEKSTRFQSVIDELQNSYDSDAGLSAYPGARQQLKDTIDKAKKSQGVVQQESALRQKLAADLESGNQAAVREDLASLKALKTANTALYPGKSTIASPAVDCGKLPSAEKCDQLVPTQPYGDMSGPGSSVKGKPCYGTSLTEWDGWDAFEKNGCVTAEERKILETMSENEGSFESVQAYDKAQLTFGSMQKTMGDDGTGELPTQISQFATKNPDQYKELFVKNGWSVKNNKLYYTDSAQVSRTGTDLGTWLRTSKNADAVKALSPLRRAGRDPEFRKKQVCDFVDRLHSSTDRKVKVGEEEFSAGDYLTSPHGKALILDTSVNAGPNEKSFQKSVDKFYKTYTKAPKDPNTWTAEQRQTYEQAILKEYESRRPVTDRPLRNKNLSGLSDQTNADNTSSKRPATTCADCTH